MELDYVKLRDIKPALSGNIRSAQLMLKKAPFPDEKAIHDIRVLMKKSRAFLKLVTPQIENGYTDRDFNSLREVGRIMSEWRETSVHRKTLKEFRKDYPDIFSRLEDNLLLRQMIEKQEVKKEGSDKPGAEIDQVVTLLNKTSYRIRFQTMNALDPQSLIRVLDDSYRRVGLIYLKCRNNPTSEGLHKFRKRTKDFLYQLYIFKPLNPSGIKDLEKKLDNMTQNLGKYHDISQIIKILGYEYRKGSNPEALDELIIKFRDKQDLYLSKVWPTAYQIFCPGQKLVNVLGFKLLVI